MARAADGDPGREVEQSSGALPSKAQARATGARAVRAMRRGLAERVADIIRSDPERAASAVEVGIIDARWLDAPTSRPVSTATPTEVLERFLERSVEQRPSLLGNLGLNALQLLSGDTTSDRSGTPQELVVMFTDLEGFTRFTSQEGDAAAIALLAEHQRLVGPVVRRAGGRVVKRLGDGLLLTFTDAENAVCAATELLPCAPEPLRLRAGAHLGETLVVRDDVLGNVVNIAARVTEHAGGGTALVTKEVRVAAGDMAKVSFGKGHRVRLKGVPDRVTVYPVVPTP